MPELGAGKDALTAEDLRFASFSLLLFPSHHYLDLLPSYPLSISLH